jgi:sulfhydrogenase subunit delta
VRIAHFLEASSSVAPGPYDLSLVEGSITTDHDAERIREIRRVSRRLVTIGACATAGGIQALRNFADVTEFTSVVYAHPEYVATLPTPRPRPGWVRSAGTCSRSATTTRASPATHFLDLRIASRPGSG